MGVAWLEPGPKVRAEVLVRTDAALDERVLSDTGGVRGSTITGGITGPISCALDTVRGVCGEWVESVMSDARRSSMSMSGRAGEGEGELDREVERERAPRASRMDESPGEAKAALVAASNQSTTPDSLTTVPLEASR